jgi:hypothetical protein
MQSTLCCLIHDSKRWYNGMLGFLEHAQRPIQRFHQNFIEGSLTSKLYYSINSKLCIYTDYMVGFENSAWIYYIQKLNNDQYLSNRKHLSIKFGFKCSKQPLGSLYCRYYVCEHLRMCGTYKVNREDVSYH